MGAIDLGTIAASNDLSPSCVTLYKVSSGNVNLVWTEDMWKDLHICMQYVSSFWRIFMSGVSLKTTKESMPVKFFFFVIGGNSLNKVHSNSCPSGS